MKVSVIGAGTTGRATGIGLHQYGHQVIFYDISDPLDPDGYIDKTETLEFGRGRIESVMEKSSTARGTEKDEFKENESCRFVITR